jgi:hypothetical protein
MDHSYNASANAGADDRAYCAPAVRATSDGATAMSEPARSEKGHQETAE